MGLESFAEVGVQVSIFNRNQGNVKSAQAGLARARQEVQRVTLSLRARFAPAFKDYSNSLGMARKYHNQMLPRAQQAYELYLKRYQEMAAASLRSGHSSSCKKSTWRRWSARGKARWRFKGSC